MSDATFVWLTCHVGAEPFLRSALQETGLRPAFARPGLLTFKHLGEVPPDGTLPRPHPLARTWGVSLGRAHDAAGIAEILAQTGWDAVLHAFPGEAGPPGQVPARVLEQWVHQARTAEDAVVAAVGGRARPGPARLGDHVIDVIVRPNEPWFVGTHVHDLLRGPLAGGGWPMTPPADAPSRAWAKLNELCEWAGVGPKAPELVLEVGAASGGATVALLDRGARVISVDASPFTLPERLRAAPFQQKVAPMEALRREDLPEDVEWLVVDVSMAAPVALHVIESLVPRYRRKLKGCFATLRLNEWELAGRIPAFLRQIQALGFRTVRAACLPSFRQEIGVIALP